MDIGQREPSFWCLELSNDDGTTARGLVVSLYRLDSLQVEVDVVISLTIQGYQVSGLSMELEMILHNLA